MSRFEPPRWSEPHSGEGPALLRDAFSAGRDENPDPGQMRALAAKLTALSAGVAVSAAAGKAAAAKTTAATAASGMSGSLAAVKLAVSIAVVVTGTTSAVIWYQSSWAPSPRTEETPAAVASPHGEAAEGATAAVREPEVAPATARSANGKEEPTAFQAPATPPEPAVEGMMPKPSAAKQAGVRAGRAMPSSDARVARRRARITQRAQPMANQRRAAAPNPPPRRRPKASAQVGLETAPSSEIELLRRARQALALRPQETLDLTEQHRAIYPDGAFAQEREALTIQALLRVGREEKALELAEQFVRSHPNSPLSHQLRASMNLR